MSDAPNYDSPKIPIVDTLTGALTYAGGGYLTILKIFIIPFLIFIIPTLALVVPVVVTLVSNIGDLEGAGAEALRALLPLLSLYPLLLILGLMFYAMIMVPINRHIVLGEEPGFFRLDGYVWRVFLGQLLIMLVILAVVIGGVLVMGLLVSVLGGLSGGDGGGWAAAALIPLALIIGIFYLFVRLSLFLVDISVTGEISLGRAFSLTKGYFWPLTGTYLLMMVAVMAFGLIFQMVFSAGLSITLLGDMASLDEAVLAENPMVILNMFLAFLLGPVGLILAILYLAYTAFIAGFEMSIPALLYRVIAGEEELGAPEAENV